MSSTLQLCSLVSVASWWSFPTTSADRAATPLYYCEYQCVCVCVCVCLFV